MLRESQFPFELPTLKPQRVNFALKGGAVGDYCAWMASILYIAKNFPHVKGHLYAPPYFIDVPENILAPFPNFKVHPVEQLTQAVADTHPTFIPVVAHPTLSALSPINPSGAHLVDMGFIYFCNRNQSPTVVDGLYPELNLKDQPDILSHVGPIAVMTPGHTSKLRAMPAHTFNRIKNHLIERGLTPVFLGRTEMTSRHQAYFNKEYDYSGGIDLVNETTLLEAAKIIERAKLIVGLDNGLLHLAGMTRTSIVYGHNIIEPELRSPRRLFGLTVDVIPPSSLLCRFCKSKQRFLFLPNQAVNLCTMTLDDKNVECLSSLTPEMFIDAIEEVLAVCQRPR